MTPSKQKKLKELFKAFEPFNNEGERFDDLDGLKILALRIEDDFKVLPFDIKKNLYFEVALKKTLKTLLTIKLNGE